MLRQLGDARLVPQPDSGVVGHLGQPPEDPDRLIDQSLPNAQLGHRLGVKHVTTVSRARGRRLHAICAISAVDRLEALFVAQSGRGSRAAGGGRRDRRRSRAGGPRRSPARQLPGPVNVGLRPMLSAVWCTAPARLDRRAAWSAPRRSRAWAPARLRGRRWRSESPASGRAPRHARRAPRSRPAGESSRAARRTSPSAQSSRTRVDEQGIPSMVTGGITATPRPSSAPERRQPRHVSGPAAPEAEVVADHQVAGGKILRRAPGERIRRPRWPRRRG